MQTPFIVVQQFLHLDFPSFLKFLGDWHGG